MPAGQGIRCWGFISDDGDYVHCMREEYAKGISQGPDGAYAHKRAGRCKCGVEHQPGPIPAPSPRRNDAPKVNIFDYQTALYEYESWDGRVWEKGRFEPPGQRKVFLWREKGITYWPKGNSSGARMDQMRLYGRGSLVLTDEDTPVFVGEGEKTQQALLARGLPAVSLAGGAAMRDIGRCLEDLQGHWVALFRDNDKEGDGFIRNIAERLEGIASRISFVYWETAPPKGDAADFFEAGGTTEQLLGMLRDDLPPFEPEVSPPDEAGPTKPATNLPAAFWESRVSLSRIRQAAHARHRSADAVLGVCLARLAAMIEPARIDTGVGSRACLNFFSALVGAPGVGKSDAHSIACELYPAPAQSEEWFADNQPLGTGEGLAEAFMGTVTVDDPSPRGNSKKTVQVRKQVRHNAFFFVDEGEKITKMLDRVGATIGEALRSAWKGVTLGQRNGSVDRTRHVINYALGLAVGFQPTTVRPLLEDVTSGTPQRFVFFSATDPSIPKEPVSWPPYVAWWSQYLEDKNWTVAESVLEEIRATDYMVATSEIVLESFDAHAMLTKVKLAGLLAVLEQRKNINEEDWVLADVIWCTSQAVRDEMISKAEEEKGAKERAYEDRAVRREMLLLDAREERSSQQEERAMQNAMNAIVRHVSRGNCEGGCKRRCLQRAIASRDRLIISADQAIEEAVNEGLLVRHGEVYECP